MFDDIVKEKDDDEYIEIKGYRWVRQNDDYTKDLEERIVYLEELLDAKRKRIQKLKNNLKRSNNDRFKKPWYAKAGFKRYKTP